MLVLDPQRLKDQGKGVVFIGSSFIYGLLGNKDLVPQLGELEGFLAQVGELSAKEDRERALKKLNKEQQEQKSKEAEDAKSNPPAAAASSSAPAGKAKQLVRTKDTVAIKTKKTNEKITGIVEFVVFTYEGHQEKVVEWFKKAGFVTNEQ